MEIKRVKFEITFLFVITCLLSFFHLRVDMAQWTIFILRDCNAVQLLQLTCVMLHTIICIFLLLLLVIRSKIMAYVVFPFFFFVWAIPTCARLIVGHCLYSELITGALGTNWKEVSGFITPLTVICFLFGVVLCFGISYLCRNCFKWLQSLSGKLVWSIAIGYIGITMIAVSVLATYYPKSLIPILFAPSNAKGEEKVQLVKNQLAGMENEYRPQYPYRVLMPFYRQAALFYYIFDYYNVDKLKKAETLQASLVCDDDIVVVLFIGESYRADHASWNGYFRETLPYLTKEKGNIINFPYFKSYATTTASSIYGMLSDATCNNREARHTSFIGLMNKYGFSSRLLLCRTTGWHRNPKINSVLDGQLKSVYMSDDSESLLGEFENIILKGGKQFILIEDGTGHAPYEHESRFAIFGTKDKDRYDSCLLQTDELLYRLIQKLKGKKAVMLYSSDHGQSFGEQGCSMHGGALNVVSQRHVFSFVWTSELFEKAHLGQIQAMQNNAKKLLSHDDIYKSILSLSGIYCDVPAEDCGDFTAPLNRPEVTKFSLNEKE